MRATIIIVI